MTTTIEVDPQTAEALRTQAASFGLTLAEYLRTLAEAPPFVQLKGGIPISDFDRVLDALAEDLPEIAPLPADFSRADLYADHD
ncbi:MAG TPA: hypothetical protein VGM03_13020 [Phycisphaerae bacterium]